MSRRELSIINLKSFRRPSQFPSSAISSHCRPFYSCPRNRSSCSCSPFGGTDGRTDATSSNEIGDDDESGEFLAVHYNLRDWTTDLIADLPSALISHFLFYFTNHVSNSTHNHYGLKIEGYCVSILLQQFIIFIWWGIPGCSLFSAQRGVMVVHFLLAVHNHNTGGSSSSYVLTSTTLTGPDRATAEQPWLENQLRRPWNRGSKIWKSQHTRRRRRRFTSLHSLNCPAGGGAACTYKNSKHLLVEPFNSPTTI